MEEEKKLYSEKNQRQERPGRSQGEQKGEPKAKREGRRNSRDFGRPDGERDERPSGRERRPRGERNRRKTYDRAAKGERHAGASSVENEMKERERRGSPKGPRRQNKRNVKERGERWEDGRRNRRLQDERTEDERQRRPRREENSEEQKIAGRRSEDTELPRLSEAEAGSLELKAVHHEEIQLPRAEKKSASTETGTARRDKQEERIPASRAERKRKSWDKLDTDEMKAENDRLDEEIQAEIEALSQISL